MRKYVFFMAFILNFIQVHAAPILTIPDHFEVHTRWFSPIISISEKDNKIADIFSYSPRSLSTYEMYDASDNFIMSGDLQIKTDPVVINFYHNQTRLGTIHQTSGEHAYATFYLYAGDKKRRLVKGSFNFWNTKLDLFRVDDNKKFATMSVASYCIHCTSTVDITDREIYNEIPVSPNTMLFAIALQSQRFVTRQDSSNQCNDIDSDSFDSDQALLYETINELDSGFEKNYGNKKFKTKAEKIAAYEKYCLDLLNNPQLSEEKRQVILQLNKGLFQ